MKKLLFLLLTALIAGFTSCSKETEEISEEEKFTTYQNDYYDKLKTKIIGTWIECLRYSKYTTSGFRKPENPNVYCFRADGTGYRTENYQYKDWERTKEFTYEVKKNSKYLKSIGYEEPAYVEVRYGNSTYVDLLGFKETTEGLYIANGQDIYFECRVFDWHQIYKPL